MSQSASKYYRVPKHYVFLPSGGKYYPEGFLTLTSSGQLPIRAMTAKDELLLKNPDALLNGDAIIKVIESCVPEVSSPKDLYAPDMEVILMAVFSASYDKSLETKLTCEKCLKESTYHVPVEQLIRQVSEMEELPAKVEHTIQTPENLIKYTVDVIPYTYDIITLAGMTELSHAQLLNSLLDTGATEEERLKAYNTAFREMTSYYLETVIKTVTKVTITDSELDEDIIIEDKNELEDFIYGTEKQLIDKIQDKVKELNSSGIDTTFGVTCPNNKCNHEWRANMDFDAARFFAKRSSQGTPR